MNIATFKRIGVMTFALVALFVVLPATTTDAQAVCDFDAVLDVSGETTEITITEGDTVDFRLRALNVTNCLEGWRHNFDFDSNVNPGWEKEGGNISAIQNSGSFTYTTPGTYTAVGEIRNGKASQGDPITPRDSNVLTVIVEEDTPVLPACNRNTDIQPVSGSWPVIGSGSSKISMTSGGSAQVTFKNVSTNPDCAHDMGLATYQIFNNDLPEFLTTQQLFDESYITIQPGETKTLKVDVPTCRAQSDLFEGPDAPHSNPDFANLSAYRLYDANSTNGTGLCGEVEPDPAICLALSASPKIINQGQSTTLTWSTQNVKFNEGDTVSINKGVGQLNTTNGSVLVNPVTNTTYTLTVTDNNGKITNCPTSVQVNVTEDPVCDVYFENVTIGTTSTGDLVWTSSNFESVTFNQGLNARPLEGRINGITVAQTTTYTGTFFDAQTETTKQCSDTLTVRPVQSQTDVAIAKLVDGVKASTGLSGTVFEYTLHYINNGPAAAENVVITDVPDVAGIVIDYQLEDAPNSATCSISQTGTILECKLGTLQVGQSGTITYSAIGNNDGMVNNVAQIETTTPETDYTNNEDDAKVTVYSSEYTDITIEKFVRNSKNGVGSNAPSASGDIDDTFIYTLKYRNAGSIGAADVTIIDVLADTDHLENITILTETVANGCSVTGNDAGISCDIGFLPVGGSGTITYSADAKSTGSVRNDVVIDTVTPEEPAPDGVLPNEDDARVTITDENEADASITKTVDPSSGEIGTVFTYELTYKHESGPTVINVELDDTPDQDGYLDNFKIISTPNGVTCDVKSNDTGIFCEVGNVGPNNNSEGTIVYEARGIKEGTVDNTVILTGDNDSVESNNRDDARVRLFEDECRGDCGGSDDGRKRRGGGVPRSPRDPDIVLFERPEPQVLGTVALNQVPYTGVGDVFLVIFFFAALLAAAGFITYVVLKKRKAGVHRKTAIDRNVYASEYESGTVRIDRTPQPTQQEAYTPIAPVIPGMNPLPTPASDARRGAAPANLPVAETPVVPASQPVHIPASTETSNIAAAELEQMASAHKTLLSGEARKMILEQAENNPARVEQVLSSVIEAAKERFPREDGWLLLNQSRVAQVLMKEGLSTIPMFIGWMLARNEKQLFGFLRNLSSQGTAPEHFIRQVIAELDAVYQARLDNVHPQADAEVVALLKDVPAVDLEMIITSLARSLDGRYSSPLDGVKVALTRIMSAGNTRMTDSTPAPKEY